MAKQSKIQVIFEAAVRGLGGLLGLNKAIDDTGKQADKSSKGVRRFNTDVDGTSKSSRGATRGLKGLLAGLRGIGAALAARAFAKTNADLESLDAGLKAVFGSSEAAARELDYVREVAARMGVKTNDAAKAYLDLSAAAKGTELEGEQTRRIFEAVTLAMGRLGKSSADTQGALRAIQQMMSKGKVSAEELRGQLGERLPGAFQLAAKSIGVTTAELDNMLQQGGLTANELLPKLATELDKLYNTGEEISTLSSNWNRLVNAVSLFATEAGKTTNGVSIMNAGLKTLASLINFVNVGFTSLVAYTKAAGTAFVEFMALVSFSQSFDQFKKNVDDAFGEAEQTIIASADAVFGLDRSLAHAGDTARQTAQDINAVSGASKTAADAAREQADSAVVLVEQLRAIDELQRQGVITEKQAVENKQALKAAYQETLPVLERTKEETKALSDSLSQYAQSAKTAAELDYVQATAMRELKGNTEALGTVMARVTEGRNRLAEATRKSLIEDNKDIIAKAKTAKSSFDLALAMVRLIEQQKKLNLEQKSGVLTQEDYAKESAKVRKEIEVLAKKEKELAGAQKGVSDGNKDIAGSADKASGRTKVFNEVIGDTSTVMEKMIAHLKFWQDEMDGLSESARKAFDSMLESVNRAGGAMVTSFDASAKAAQDNSAEIAGLSRQLDHMRTAYAQATGDVNRWMIAVEAAGLAVKRSFLQQEDAAAKLEERLDGLNGLTEEQAKSLEQAANSYTLLDQTRLDNIKSQIDSLRQATDALNESSLATLTGLQNELDRLNGNLLAIENRNYEQRRLELIEQINAAQEAGDALAVQRLQESLALLKKIHEIKLADLAADQAASGASSGTSTSFNKDRSGRASKTAADQPIVIENKTEAVFIVDGKEMARVVQPYITEFGKLSG